MAEVLLNQEQIKEIIPHRDPFLLIDEVLEMEVGKRVVARKYIKADDFWFKGHFPEKPVTPGVLMIEMLAQAGAVCILSQPEFKGKIALFAGIDKAKFRRQVVPGDVLDLEVEIIAQRGPVGVGKAIASVEGKRAVTCEIKFAVKQKAAYDMWKKVLIANRGEIAVRIIRACREAGLQCVTVYSTADKTALHAEIADESVCIGPPSVQDSYLNMNALISACQNTGAEALHPGFGFLSESAEFAQLCIDNGITFIGPSPASISMLGDKARAKETMKAAGVPVIPGSDGAVTSVEEAKKIAAEIGYPVLVKASAGGGGRGIRRIDREDQLEEQMSVAKEEAKLFFGNDEVYLEKLIVGPHHVEIQIIADQMGNTVALGERDCSMQRRNQKVLEESPSPLMTPELRKAMQEAAVRAAKACGYYNAGTIEFLVDDDRNFYFMEMNTRIQVEHPVTEWVTGVDLVQTQLLVAQGKPLPFTQDDIEVRGHAIECRINAENPEQGFRPSPGKIRSLHIPGGPGIRVDSAVYQGYTIPPYYDSMIAKLIVHAPTRSQAIMKMRWALAEFIVDGIDSNIDFQLRLIKNKDFEAGTYDNTFLEKFLADSKNDKDNGK